MKIKQILSTVPLLLFSISMMAQVQSFTLSGRIAGQNTGMLKLSYPGQDGKFFRDSAIIADGNFQFKGKVAEPVMAYLTGNVKSMAMDDPNGTSLFLEPGKLKLTITAGDFKNFELTGSSMQQEYMALQKQKHSINASLTPLNELYSKANEAYRMAIKEKKPESELEMLKGKAESIKEQMEPYLKQSAQIDLEYIKAHPNSYLSAYLMRYRISSMSLSVSKAIYSGFSTRIKESSYGKEIANEIKGLEGGSPGSRASVFTARDINGQMMSLSDFKGKKYVLLDFWASWCGPCRKGNPHLLTLYSQYKDRGLEIIGVSDDDSNTSAWKKAVEQDQIGVWKHVLRGLKRTANGYDKSNEISGPYGIHTLPTKILIDKEGMIIGRYGGGGEDDAAMDQKLKEIFN